MFDLAERKGGSKMKKTFLLCLIVGIIFTFTPSVMAKENHGKPQDVIARSNGAPSGPHFNLNIHGKKRDYICTQRSGGNSVFVYEYGYEYGSTTIQYVSNKKSSVTQLEVLDSCDTLFANSPDENPVKVMLPHKIDVDGTVIPAGGFHVYGRILGKPNNGSQETASNVILYPNVVLEACNDPLDPNIDFGEYTSCNDLALGLIYDQNLYKAEDEVYKRFDPEATSGKGNSKFTNITDLFTYTGWAADASLDISGPNGVPDGAIDEWDIPIDAEAQIAEAGYIDANNLVDISPFDGDPDFGNNSGDIDLITEWLFFQASLTQPMAWYLYEQWIFNLADLVITSQGLVMDGAKLLQIRFYPEATLQFTP
jgi:hypothetical protein